MRYTDDSARQSARYPLEDVVEANRYVETGQKTGNVVLTVSHDPTT